MPAQNQLEKKYSKSFENGTNVAIKISIEYANLNLNDSREILSYIAQCSHKFYFNVADQLISLDYGIYKLRMWSSERRV